MSNTNPGSLAMSDAVASLNMAISDMHAEYTWYPSAESGTSNPVGQGKAQSAQWPSQRRCHGEVSREWCGTSKGGGRPHRKSAFGLPGTACSSGLGARGHLVRLERDVMSMLVDDCVWMVQPDGRGTRAAPVGTPIHPPNRGLTNSERDGDRSTYRTPTSRLQRHSSYRRCGPGLNLPRDGELQAGGRLPRRAAFLIIRDNTTRRSPAWGVLKASEPAPPVTIALVPKMRDEELWVAACVEATLPGVLVCQHDDGSRSSMYDLDLVRDGKPFAAMEVTAAADADSIELWNLINGSEDRWIESNLIGGWLVTLTPKARANRVKKELPVLLRTAETHPDGPERQAVCARLGELGVMSAHQSGTDFRGSIYVTLQRDVEQTGGAVPSTGDGLVKWFNSWVQDSAQRHNLDKLRAAETRERHLFVLLPGFTTAPFTASDVLMCPDRPLTTLAPTLPRGISDLWFMSTWSTGDLFRFGPDGWSRSQKVFEVAGS